MVLHNFGTEDSIINKFIAELRDEEIQKDSMRFRKNIERIGAILGYELSKTLDYQNQTITSPFGTKQMSLPENELVLCSVLRAGLPLHQGLLNSFDAAENAFISAYRYHTDNEDKFEVIVRYLAAPSIEGKTLILTDPMLATGKTLENVYNALKTHGTPKKIHIVSVIGSEEGIDYVSNVFPEDTQLWISAVDETLSPKGYILPGLGDAGDLSFGVKL